MSTSQSEFDLSEFQVGPRTGHHGSGATAPYGHVRGNNGNTSGASDIYAARIAAKKQELLAFLLQGYSLRDAAKLMGMSHQTAHTYMRDPSMLVKLKEASEAVYEQVAKEFVSRKVEAHQRILEMSDNALNRLEELMESENENVALRAVDSVLDRHGEVPRASKNVNVSTIVKVDADMLKLAAQAAAEIEAPRKAARGMLKADGDHE